MANTIALFVLDTTSGQPAQGVRFVLQRHAVDGHWETVADGFTARDGLAREALGGVELADGEYRLIYDTHSYFLSRNMTSIYRQIRVDFIAMDHRRYVLPLLMGPYSYTTYLGS